MTDEDAIVEREAGLHKALTRGQITMMGLGGAIGTGLFMGSGIAIGYAGPAVMISYAIAAFIAVVMVLSLSEMAVMHPAAGSFGVYAETYLNPWAGYLVRWTYWFCQVVAVGGDAVAAGTYMSFWFPGVPVWIWSLGFAGAIIFLNTRSVKNFGTFEYWFALIKVTAIVLFIILGGAAILGVAQPAVGVHNLTGLPGGFAPHGLKGIWMGVIIGIFSFIGVELIAVTAAETPDPKSAIPAALRSMAVRLFLFYILALTILVSFIPWTDVGAKVVAQSPFVRVFAHTGVPYAAGIMNFVVLTAALSSMNANTYLTGRMLFSLSRGNYAPRQFGVLNRLGAPAPAIVFSGLAIVAAAMLSKLTPAAYNYLFGISLFGAIFVWMMILVSHFAFRRRHRPEELPVRMPFFPVPQIVGLVLLAAILVTMGLDTEFWDISWIVGVPWLILLTIAYFAWKRRSQSALRIAGSG
ncbi:amino acid permease [Phenylobacterium sp.]|uniref:amino acid permease n=1 Tax=Phenylobacterium sp. TaxID=1871053 RepID=UPI0011FF0F0E|nr:amino acid permease [Phenylobacterium sp.]THD61008.1 MAG: amino acid permease [Phenylobacterium sp.]